MSKVNQQDIDKLIELVGGRDNIATVSHCITRKTLNSYAW
jgi:PTS system trehalose-specific IIC component